MKLYSPVRNWRFHKNSEDFQSFLGIYRETTPIVLVSVIIELIVGIELLNINEYYVTVPGLLLIIPGLMENRGNVISNLAQRLSSSIHLGTVSWDLGFNDEIKVNILATIILNVSVSTSLAILGFIGSIILNINHIGLLGFLVITLFMSLVIGTILTLIAIFIVLLSHKLGLDPDNVTIPAIATVGDLFTIISIFISINFAFFINQFIPLGIP